MNKRRFKLINVKMNKLRSMILNENRKNYSLTIQMYLNKNKHKTIEWRKMNDKKIEFKCFLINKI